MPDPWSEFHSAPPALQSLADLQRRGAVVTNGYRTDADYFRLKAAGYTPARNGAHPKGDGVDLAPGGEFRSLGDLQRAAQAQFGPNAVVEIHNGTHVHVATPDFEGDAPDVTRGRSDPWSEFKPAPQAKPAETLGDLRSSTALTPLSVTGQAHDGDTMRLSNGQNGRLLGFDAFELAQQGRKPDGSLVPLGQKARSSLLDALQRAPRVNATGEQTYGRPVVTLGDLNNDPARAALRQGLGMAEPDFLKGSPQFGPYMEAERLARLNGLGGFATNAETPSQFRHHDGPWQGATPAPYGQGKATFFDDPTPFEGLRPDIAKAYLEFSRTAKTPQELIQFGKEHGFDVPFREASKFIANRIKAHGKVGQGIDYIKPPRPSIDPGDKTFGSFARGIGDPFNALDELGAIPDTLGLTGGRENLFNSNRRFGDIFANNIDQNRAILEHDEEAHPVARIAGQLTSGVALPIGAASSPARLATIMGAEGGLSGLMAGEGNLTARFPNAALGTVIGTVGGGTLGLAGEHVVSPLVRRYLQSRAGAAADDVAREVTGEALPVLNDGLQNAGPTPAARAQPQGGVTAAMAADRGPELVGPVAGRKRDVINVHDLPPLPEGFRLEQPFGVTRQTGERLAPDEMAKLAEGVDPRGAIPRPANAVETLGDSLKANPSNLAELKAPNELDSLGVRTVTTRTGGKVRIRGPLDVTQSIRLMGGLKDEGGELAHSGITNEPRRMPFGSNEQFLGKLIDNERGMSLDDATRALWEEGYFPQFRDRPTPDDLLEVLHDESSGAKRYFHPSEQGEIADFERAQAQRGAVETAASSGSPLVEERGHSINLDDLVANTPPAETYADAPRLTGKIGNINLDRLDKPQDVSALIDQVSKRVGGFDAAARGRVTHEETQRLAQEIGVKPEQLLKRQQGQALNAEQLYASRALVQRSRETVARLAKKAVGGSDEDVATFRKAWLKHAALEEQITGATAEAGRALSQFRMLAKAQDAGGDAVRAYLKGAGGKESIEDAASAIVDLMEDPAKASHFMRESVKPRWRDKLNELWINSLLSGPRTHVVNFVGNALTTAMSFPELATTAAIGKLTRSQDRAMFGEVTARASGLADSSLDALKAAKIAFKTGEPLDHSAKVENVHHQAIGGTLGKIVRTPTRALTAADEFWKSILTHGELRQIAYRTAKRETNTPESFKARYQALVRSPTDAMLKDAHASARYWTFQRELGPSGRAVQQFSNNFILGKLLLPFVRTPSNIIKFAGERSAFGLAMPEVRQALRAGGRARDEALAKISLGSGLSTAAVVAALDGRITGSGPTDPRERAALLQSGWQPNSIRIGDKWVSYSRFDPVSTLIGVAADFAEAGKWATNKEADEVALNLGLSIAKNITNKTWLSGLSDAFDVLSDPERYGKSYVQKLAGSMAVPALASQTAQAIDPNLRDARTIMDAIKARVPVVSESVPVRRNVWGDPVSNGDAIGPDIISPFYATRMSRDPVNVEIARLRVPLTLPQRSVTVEGKRVPLDAKQYDELVQLSGKPAKQYLEQQMRSPEWKTMGDEDRRQFVKDAFEDFRATARAELLSKHPDLAGLPSARSQALNLVSAAKNAPRTTDPWAEFKSVPQN